MGGVDGRPAVGEVEFPHQQFDRAQAAEGEAVVHLLHLLGDMDMDGGIRRKAGDHLAQQVRRHCPQRMGRDADMAQCTVLSLYRQVSDDPQESLGMVQEAPLAGHRVLPAKASEGVERGQDGDADPCMLRCSKTAEAHLGGVGIGGAVRPVVQVLELAHHRETGFQHLDIELRRYGFEIVGR